ncbi:MAG: thioredoxin domain-containing protein, partial [Gemmatimonadaceae bacterium]
MNRLAHETSPYLLQHAGNPVDWYPWGSEALDRARGEDKPILLSVGYAACHWCHVMEHESFEDATTAALMNELYVNIKVDREERPDLDSIYMQAVQAMTGQGGWPMTVFLTPEGEPFYGGTYFPPNDRHGMPGFRRVLASVHEAYRTKRDAVTNTAQKLREIYDTAMRPMPRGVDVDAAALERAFHVLAQSYDPMHGGFGGAPKFPPSMSLDFLLRWYARTGTEQARDITTNTMRAMVRGGIYDQVGGGLHRYSVDEKWLVPHFEKMLYDNALFARLGVHLWQATGDEEIRRAAIDTLHWVIREMTSPEGGFYSSLDADSEGEEGKFYVWSERELDELLGSDAPLLKALWGVTPGGNFEGENILNVAVDPAEVAQRHGVSLDEVLDTVRSGREVLYAVRAKRTWPGRDEKILAGWNGLMLRAFCEGARVFDNATLRSAALRNAEFLRTTMWRDGRVIRSYKGGSTRDIGFLEDHASIALGFLDVYALTFDEQWLDEARRVAESAIERFHD